MKITQNINYKELLSKINDADIYNKYYYEARGFSFEFNKRCNNPYTPDDNPSFMIYYKDGECFHKAFNSPHKGNCWQFIMDLFGISYDEAVEKVAKDFNLLEGDKYLEILSNLPKIEKKEKKDVDIKFSTLKNFTKAHIDYLNQFHLNLEDIHIFEDTLIYPVKRFWINKEPFILKNEIGFAYYIPEINKVKVYLPQREKGNKFWSSIPFDYIHGLNQIKFCKKAIITKSVKDAWVLKKAVDICQTVVQAENPTTITNSTIDFFNNNVEETYVSFDSDLPGVENSKIITKKAGWKYINPEKKYLPLKDWADVSKHYGLEVIQEHFKNKKII